MLPRFDTWTGPFEVVQIDAGAPASAVGDRTSAIWQIRLRTFDLGEVRIPGIPFDFQQLGLRERQSARTDDFVVESLAPAVEAGASIRPLADVVEPRIDAVDIVVAGATAALVLLAVVWLAMRLDAARRRRAAEPGLQHQKSAARAGTRTEGHRNRRRTLLRAREQDDEAIPGGGIQNSRRRPVVD